MLGVVMHFHNQSQEDPRSFLASQPHTQTLNFRFLERLGCVEESTSNTWCVDSQVTWLNHTGRASGS